tara:strand:+ start:11849 stop:12331 length:483 start_codon:yes stop_codon:yes gene_type:complete
MANELQFYGNPALDSGLTIKAKIYDHTGTQIGSDVTCVEVGVLAIYRGDMPTTSAGEYVVRFFESTLLKGQGIIYWSGSDEINLNTIDAAVSGLLSGNTILEGSITFEHAQRIMLSALAGKVSGAGTGTEIFRDINDTKDRITSTVDNNGNRTNVVTDGT